MPGSLTPETLVYNFKSAAEPKLSANGSWVLFSLVEPVRDSRTSASQLWLHNVETGQQRQLTDEGLRNWGARWSPDGSQIAFFSDRASKTGIFVLTLAGGETVEITRHNVALSDISWSPDGSKLAYTALYDPENPDERVPGAGEAAPIRATSRIDYKQDNRGFLNDLRPQVWVVDVAAKARRRLTSEPVDHLNPAWSPDGRWLAAKIPNRNGMCAQLGLIDAATGETTLIGSRDGDAGC